MPVAIKPLSVEWSRQTFFVFSTICHFLLPETEVAVMDPSCSAVFSHYNRLRSTEPSQSRCSTKNKSAGLTDFVRFMSLLSLCRGSFWLVWDFLSTALFSALALLSSARLL